MSAPPAERLTDRQRRFVAEYLASGGNAAEAARKAGYAERGAAVQGHRLLTNANVRRAVAARLRSIETRAEVTAERVLRELARVAFADITDLVTVRDGRVTVADTDQLTPDQSAAVAEISIRGGRADVDEPADAAAEAVPRRPPAPPTPAGGGPGAKSRSGGGGADVDEPADADAEAVPRRPPAPTIRVRMHPKLHALALLARHADLSAALAGSMRDVTPPKPAGMSPETKQRVSELLGIDVDLITGKAAPGG